MLNEIENDQDFVKLTGELDNVEYGIKIQINKYSHFQLFSKYEKNLMLYKQNLINILYN